MVTSVYDQETDKNKQTKTLTAYWNLSKIALTCEKILL